MNQSILFNDDLAFDQSINAWTFTGLVAGELIKIIIQSSVEPYQEALPEGKKLDWEMDVEEWLEDNEPEQGIILLYG